MLNTIIPAAFTAFTAAYWIAILYLHYHRRTERHRKRRSKLLPIQFWGQHK